MSNPIRQSLNVLFAAGRQLVKIWSDSLTQRPTKQKTLVQPANKPEESASFHPIEFGTLEDLRRAHGVMPSNWRRGLPLSSMPAGTMGYTIPWNFQAAPVARRAGTSTLEVHKSLEGVRYIIGFIDDRTLQQLKNDPHAGFTLCVIKWAGHRHSVAIPFVKLTAIELQGYDPAVPHDEPDLLDLRII